MADEQIRKLHKPLRRYHDGSGEFSMDTAEDVAREYEIPVEDVSYFEVCAHCAFLETWHPSEAGVDYDYRESLWPCATIRALLRTEEEVRRMRAALAAIRDRHGRHGERDWCDACWPGTTYPCWTRTTAERGLGTEEET